MLSCLLSMNVLNPRIFAEFTLTFDLHPIVQIVQRHKGGIATRGGSLPDQLILVQFLV